MNLQTAAYAAGIVNEAKLSEPIHEKADSGTGGPNHLGQRFLADLGNQGGFLNAIFAEMRK